MGHRKGEEAARTRTSLEAFEKVLRYGLAGKSTGIMMFTLVSVAQDADKMAVLKKVYNEVKAQRSC